MTPQQRMVVPTKQDYDRLWEVNPLSHEQLKNIVLQRLLIEAEAKLDPPENGAGKTSDIGDHAPAGLD
tara:strand:+ start:1184 stop:1387 length:204 start_codon:yes stop_codon:yes gene_type:complete